MEKFFMSYWESLWRDIPVYAYGIGTVIFCIGVAICLYRWGIRRGLRWSSRLLLVEYVGLIYCSTVIFRSTGEIQYDFIPMWSYLAYFKGENDRLLVENVMNVVVFVPVGLLAGIAFVNFSWRKAMVLGAGLSMSIEALQLTYKKGFTEVDDVIHNTLGCIIGYSLWRIVLQLAKH